MADDRSVSLDGEQPGIDAYDRLVAEIEQIVQRLESGTLTLAEALQEYQRGIELINLCNSLLDQAELKITELATGCATPDGQAPLRGSYDRFLPNTTIETIEEEYRRTIRIDPDDKLN